MGSAQPRAEPRQVRLVLAGPAHAADPVERRHPGHYAVLRTGLDEGRPPGRDRLAQAREGTLATALPGLRGTRRRGGPPLPPSPILPGMERAQGVLEQRPEPLGLRGVHPAVQRRVRRAQGGRPDAPGRWPLRRPRHLARPGRGWPSLQPRRRVWHRGLARPGRARLLARAQARRGLRVGRREPGHPRRRAGHAAVQEFDVLTKWIRQGTPLPVWWSEFHLGDGPPGGQQELAAVAAATLLRMAAVGASVALIWQPQRERGADRAGAPALWSSTERSDGGQPLPYATAVARVQSVLADHATSRSVSSVGATPSCSSTPPTATSPSPSRAIVSGLAPTRCGTCTYHLDRWCSGR